MLRQIAREPLVHFLTLGGLLFAAWSWVEPAEENGNSSDTIVLDQARLDHLETLWRAQWKHDPSPSDVEAIVDRHLRQEVFYREALRMGLDHDDEIIRTRLAQKMEAVASDLSTLMQPPTDAQLRRFYAERPELFTLPPAFAFRQVLYLPSEADDATLSETLAALRNGAAIPADRRNKLGIAQDWELTATLTIANAFGDDFTRMLADLPPGQWAGPIRSGMGEHLVQITAQQPQQVAAFDDIRDFVARQYEYYSVMATQDRVFLELLEKYRVEISAEGVPDAVRQEYVRR